MKHAAAPRRPPGLAAVHRQWEHNAVPLALAAFAVLAAVRIGGAWSESLMVLAVALTPAALLLAPRRRVGREDRVRVRARAWAEGTAVVLASYVVVVAGCALAFGNGRDNWLAGIPVLFDDLAGGRRPVALALALVSMGALIPLAEEVCYRGVLFEAAAASTGQTGAIVLTAAGWALVHLGDYGLHPVNLTLIAGMLTSVLCMGLALGWCRAHTGSVGACVLAQGTGNLALTGWVFATWS